MRACLWKFEVGPLPVSIAASWCYRWHLAQRPPSSGQRPKVAGLCHPESSDIDTLSTGRVGLPPTQGKPRSVPLWCTLRRWDPRSLRSSVWVSVAFVPPPQVCLFFFKLQMQGKPPDIMRAGQMLTLKDSWAGLQVKSYAWEELDTGLEKITSSDFAKPWNVQNALLFCEGPSVPFKKLPYEYEPKDPRGRERVPILTVGRKDTGSVSFYLRLCY